MTSIILFGIDFVNFIRKKANCFKFLSFNKFFVRNFRPFTNTAILKKPHKFSIEIKSGLFTGHSRIMIFFCFSHFFMCFTRFIQKPYRINLQSDCIKGTYYILLYFHHIGIAFCIECAFHDIQIVNNIVLKRFLYLYRASPKLTVFGSFLKSRQYYRIPSSSSNYFFFSSIQSIFNQSTRFFIDIEVNDNLADLWATVKCGLLLRFLYSNVGPC